MTNFVTEKMRAQKGRIKNKAPDLSVLTHLSKHICVLIPELENHSEKTPQGLKGTSCGSG